MSTQQTSFPKAAAVARVLTGKPVNVYKGNVPGPCTDMKDIYLGAAVEWEPVDRFAAIIHECGHFLFPAKYPSGNLRQLANLIDDCRQERQFIATRPHYQNALECLVINVIANGKYDAPQADGTYKDHWDAANFDPALWALLFFRSYLPQDVRSAAADAINAYAAGKGYDKDAAWKAKFAELVKSGLALTRLKSVSCATLEAWCKLYFDTFPEAKRDANQSMSIAILNDNGGQDRKDQEGEGDEGQDGEMLAIATGEGQEAKDGKPGKKGGDAKGGGSKKDDQDPGEAPDAENLDEAVEKLKERIKKVGTEKQREAEMGSTGDEAREATEGDGTDEQGDDEGEGVSQDQYDRIQGGRPGRGDDLIKSQRQHQAVDKGFVNRVKTGIRKLQCLAEDRVEQDRKTGKLNMPPIMRAQRLNILPTKPFRKTVDDIAFKPVAVCVATDFSGSTEGQMNVRLNEVTHNMLYSLQSAGCECTEVVWNSGAVITKRLDQEVSPLLAKRHESTGGTELMAACLGAIKSLEAAKAQRKVVFIFTDGAVNHSELAPIEAEFRRKGVEGVLLVSLGQAVPRKGIVETATITDLNQLAFTFDTWIRRQVGKAIVA